MIPVFEPTLNKYAKKNIEKCLKTNWISSQGLFVKKLEKKISNFHKSKYCIVTSSCTSALHLALLSCGIKENDEVICPDLSFIAPANMILLSRAKPVLVDVDPITLTIDPLKIEKKITNKTKAIIVVHQFGHACNMDKILKIARKYKLKIIEDNAESIGAYYKKKLLGTIGDISTLSFFSNKILTTGEGGAIITNNKKIADYCKLMRDHGMSPKKKYKFIDLGFNYRMTNLQAAVGCSQIDDVTKILKKRNKQLENYKKYLKYSKFFYIKKNRKWCKPVHWLTTLILSSAKERKKFILYLKTNNVEARPMITPIHQAKHFKKLNIYKPYELKNSNFYSTRGVHLPSATSLSLKKIKFICKKINRYFEK